MIVFALNINVLVLLAIVVAAFVAGFLLRGEQLRRSRNKIRELEEEMLNNHARILDLERTQAMMKKNLEKPSPQR
mgnify:CR=1 FL=1